MLRRQKKKNKTKKDNSSNKIKSRFAEAGQETGMALSPTDITSRDEQRSSLVYGHILASCFAERVIAPVNAPGCKL